MDEDEDELELELDIALRSPAEAARRCIVLAALIRRLSIETLAGATPGDELDGEAFDLKAWLHTEAIWKHATAFEADFLSRPVGQLDDDETATVAWQAEGLATLGWSLGISDLAPMGDMRDVARIVDIVPGPWDQTSRWVREASLRPEPDIVRERDRAEVLEWRIALEIPRRIASASLQLEYAEAIADVAREAAAAGLVARAVDDDITLENVPLQSFDTPELERLATLAEERLRALNWLCGFGDAWDQVPLDV